MKKVFKYIILLLLICIGIYNIFEFAGQSSMVPLYYAIEAFCLSGILALHKEGSECRNS